MKHLPKPEAIIFDWDNTLVDTWPVIHSALMNTFSDMGHMHWTDIEVTQEKVSRSMRDSFPEMYGDRWEHAAKRYQHHYLSTHLDALHALPQAEEVLKALKARSIHTVLVSNKKGPTLRKEVEHMGWGGYFDNIVGSDDAAKDKPHKEPVMLAFDKSHIQPNAHVWFVGDSDVDLECALNTGCTAVLYGELAIKHKTYTATHFQNKPYDVHVHSHKQLLELLRNS